MSRINYSKICFKILEKLPPRQKEVISRRFALSEKVSKGRETLESIGKDIGVTRERVRQIERDGFLSISRTSEEKKYQEIFNDFKNRFKKAGNLIKEEQFLSEIAGGKFKKEVYFLLTLSSQFERIPETEDFYSLWMIDKKSWLSARKIIESAYKKFEKEGRPLQAKELFKELGKSSILSVEILSSYLNISKKIKTNAEGLFGLRIWPEINPRRVKDKAYLIFKKEQKPLHFSRVAEFIDSNHFQTVHNELIKDSRFVLVGRGTYALREWGYEDGTVKEVILKILKESGKPLSKEEVIKRALGQRLVKENTIFLSLSDKKHFLRNAEGFYDIKEA
jgi:DNA-directed RNA polymerase delta subunit